ncbi:proliferating cell nuclear antigen [Puccinia graminis f. sp. tritici]|uniref:DNA sliding clamp PCNA n=1 Tax=Puccinia graminis f. sp. tritici TaxID=56615 RepID=A0A5B0Q5A5_PUCGR|nr:proliferating cell nuclear antigen [Puccinia graminis f. sp. tritici]
MVSGSRRASLTAGSALGPSPPLERVRLHSQQHPSQGEPTVSWLQDFHPPQPPHLLSYPSAIMFEAKLNQAGLLKSVLDAIRELVTDVNFNCDEDGMKLQAMDNSHVALVALQLRASGFGQYRCDRQMTLGINVPSFQKITKCAAPQDIITLRAFDDGDVLNIVAETLNTDRVAEYEMKMMDIDIEHLGIPETRYDAEVTLPSSEFNRIIRDLKEMGESIRIEATKEGVTFVTNGDIGKGSVTLKHNADEKKTLKVDKDKDVIDIDSDEEKDEEQNDDEGSDGDAEERKLKKALFKKDPDEDPSQNATQETDDEMDESQDVKPKTNGAAKEEKPKLKKKKIVDDDDEEEEADEQQKDVENDEEADEDEEDEEDQLPKSKKRKLSKKAAEKSKKNGKSKAKERKSAKEKKQEEEEEDLSVSISLQQSVSLTFSIKYLSNFTKATPLAKRLTLHMSNEVPLLVAYEFDTGYVRYYLAPKIEDD